MDKVMEEYKDILASPIRVPLHCQVKHSIDLTPSSSLPNGLIYWHSILDNDEIKRQIQELLQKGHIMPKLITLCKPNCIGIEEGQDLEILYWLSGIEQYHYME